MRKPEQSMWDHIRDKIANLGHVVRVENGDIDPGFPDVDFCFPPGVEGKIELKVIRGFPKRPNTPVRIEHFTADQLKFIERRDKYGGLAVLLIKVDQVFYLFNAAGARIVYEGATRETFERIAVWKGERGWKGQDLVEALTELWETTAAP